MIPADEILEALDLSRAEPGSGFLAALFVRFNARVPFETASKILRNAEIADRSGKPRLPEVFWGEHLEQGAGGTCFARVAAFEALLQGLGFRAQRLLGKVEREGDHAALLVETAAGDVLADVGFPLPALLPARGGPVETALGGLFVETTPLGWKVRLAGGVPEGPREIEIFADPVSERAWLECWRETFAPESRFLRSVSLRRDYENRILSFAAGQVRVDDPHSRLAVPLLDRRPARLAELFEMDQSLLERAFALVGDPEPAAASVTLTAYLEVSASAEAAFAAVSRPEGYRRLLEGVADVASWEQTVDGFRFTLAPPGGGGASLTEEVSPDTSARRLLVRRSSTASSQESSWRVEEHAGATWLLRETALPGAREDLLRHDTLRGRLAGSLAVDLLAWARILGSDLESSPS